MHCVEYTLYMHALNAEQPHVLFLEQCCIICTVEVMQSWPHWMGGKHKIAQHAAGTFWRDWTVYKTLKSEQQEERQHHLLSMFDPIIISTTCVLPILWTWSYYTSYLYSSPLCGRTSTWIPELCTVMHKHITARIGALLWTISELQKLDFIAGLYIFFRTFVAE